jgi:hypothetical protein
MYEVFRLGCGVFWLDTCACPLAWACGTGISKVVRDYQTGDQIKSTLEGWSVVSFGEKSIPKASVDFTNFLY